MIFLIKGAFKLSSAVLQSALVLAEPKKNIALLTTEILKSLSCSSVSVTFDFEQAFEFIESGSIDLIVIDDIPSQPSSVTLRQINRNPIACLTPVLILQSPQNRYESEAIATLGRPMIVHKPLTPARLAAGYNTLNSNWQKPIFKEIIQTRKLCIEGQIDQAIKLMISLTKHSRVQPILIPATAHYLAQANNVTAAEKLLLGALKNSPRDLGLILALSSLYLESAMPHMALRLLKGVDATYNRTSVAFLDLIQAWLMLGRVDQCIIALENMKLRKINSDLVDAYLGRCYFSEGRTSKFNQAQPDPEQRKRFIKSWENTSSEQPIQMEAS